MEAWHGLVPVFDEPNLVSHAGLLPVLALGQAAGLDDLVADRLTVPSANPVAKIRTLVAGMLAGADSIDDLDVLRAGGTGELLAGLRAPSTIGTFLRTFTHGHVLQLRAVNRGLLAGLGARVPNLVAPESWRSSTSTTRSVRSTGMPSRARGSGTPGSGA